MEELQSICDSIGMEEYMNCILVSKGGRPAFMIQPSDYDESTADDTITKGKLQSIKKMFPDLYQLITEYGIIISKNKLNESNIKSGKDLGKILGYPCYKDYTSIDETTVAYEYELIAKLKYIPTLTNYKTTNSIFVNKCIDTSTRELHQKIKDTIETILKSDELIGEIVQSVELNELEIIPPNYILSKLQKGNNLTKPELDALLNIIYNLGFSIEFQIAIQDLNFKNPFYRGIVITLISYYINNPLEPFFPLQKFPKQEQQVIKKQQEWEQSLLQIVSPPTKGGKLKNYTRRKKSSKQ